MSKDYEELLFLARPLYARGVEDMIAFIIKYPFKRIRIDEETSEEQVVWITDDRALMEWADSEDLDWAIFDADELNPNEELTIEKELDYGKPKPEESTGEGRASGSSESGGVSDRVERGGSGQS